CIWWVILLSEDEVVGDGKGQDKAFRSAVLGHVGNATGARLLWVIVGDVDTGDGDRAVGHRTQTEDALREFTLAGPPDAGDPERLALAHDEIDAAECRRAPIGSRLEARHLKHRHALAAARAWPDIVQLAPDHRLRDLPRVRVGGDQARRVPAATQDGD